MLTDEMNKILKNNAEKYAMHYFERLYRDIQQKDIVFLEHYKNLNFKKTFFYEIIYNEPAFEAYLEKEKEEKESDGEVEQEFLKKMNRIYRFYFASFYLDYMQEKLKEIQKEFDFAKEDETYFEKRLYTGEEEAIGGKISEKERLELIKENHEKGKKLGALIQRMEHAEDEIKNFQRKNNIQ